MGDPTNPETNPYILQARCEMAAWVFLRPITWRQRMAYRVSLIFSTSGAILMDVRG